MVTIITGGSMVNCTPIKAKPFRICTGDMKFKIEIFMRQITPSTNNGVDFGEEFVSSRIYYAMVETNAGLTVFDVTNTEKIVTHTFYTRFIYNLTEENWLVFRDRNYDIINVENLNEQNRFMAIRCCLRGPELAPVNFA